MFLKSTYFTLKINKVYFYIIFIAHRQFDHPQPLMSLEYLTGRWIQGIFLIFIYRVLMKKSDCYF